MYHLVEDHFDELERVWDERNEREHGFWRPVFRPVIEQFLDCGDLRCGFARLWCATCRKDLILPYSCRRRCFCPSCHQKRALLIAEHVDEEVLGDLPVRQYVVTIPKMLRLCSPFQHLSAPILAPMRPLAGTEREFRILSSAIRRMISPAEKSIC